MDEISKRIEDSEAERVKVGGFYHIGVRISRKCANKCWHSTFLQTINMLKPLYVSALHSVHSNCKGDDKIVLRLKIPSFLATNTDATNVQI